MCSSGLTTNQRQFSKILICMLLSLTMFSKTASHKITIKLLYPDLTDCRLYKGYKAIYFNLRFDKQMNIE